MNGPIKMTREDRLRIAYEIKDRLLERYGEKVKAVGIYGSLGRKTDGPYSDIEMMCVLSGGEEEHSYEWTAGKWKAEVNVDSEDILLNYAATVDGEWPLTHGQFFSIQPLYDPTECLQNVRRAAASAPPQAFHDAICGIIVEELFEYAGKWRNIYEQGPLAFLPSLAVQTAKAGAMLLGLHHRTCYTTSATVLEEALQQTDIPAGFAPLCKLVMSGQLSDATRLLEVLEQFWEGVQDWAWRNGYYFRRSAFPLQNED